MAMPNNVKVFPRGYSGGQSKAGPTHRTREGDPVVNQLYDQFTAPVNNAKMWSFQRRVVQTAVRLFSGRDNWFMAQDRNPMVQQYNYQFLIDTLRFIGTGRRRIPIHAWPDLLSNYPVEGLDDVAERHDVASVFVDLGLSTSSDALIQMWCQRPNGISDLMYTLHLLFGDVPVKIDHPAQSH